METEEDWPCQPVTMKEFGEEVPAINRQVGGTHYQNFKIQPRDFISANFPLLGWDESNAIKYICRHKFKGRKTDIEKAIHYLQLVLEDQYGAA